MPSYSLLQPLPSVCFEGKLQFSVSQDLSCARSKYFKLPETERCVEHGWSIKPPDFSLKLYRSLSVPQKTQRKTGVRVIRVPQTTEAKARKRILLPNVLLESDKRKDPSKFITVYKPPDALESELMFVKTGKYHPEPYKNPKPHNHRQLDEDLPDIITTYERDPGNLNLKLKHLDTLQTIRSDMDFSSRGKKTSIDTYKPEEPKWDARLKLPQPPWPPKSASYSRHRRRRGAYSAFLERVEEKLSRSWKK